MRKEKRHTNGNVLLKNDQPGGSSATDCGCGVNFKPNIRRGTFTALRKLQVNDLPNGWRHQETLDVIRRVAQRVVRIRVPSLSIRRPRNIYNNERDYGGTGFAYYVDHQVVKVRTNMHVVFNEDEAGTAIIDFFLDLPGRKRPKRIEIRGSRHDFDWSISEDYASITCAPTAKLLQYMNLFSDIPVLWETSFFSDDRQRFDLAALRYDITEHCNPLLSEEKFVRDGPEGSTKYLEGGAKTGFQNRVGLKDGDVKSRARVRYDCRSFLTKKQAVGQNCVTRPQRPEVAFRRDNRFVQDDDSNDPVFDDGHHWEQAGINFEVQSGQDQLPLKKGKRLEYCKTSSEEIIGKSSKSVTVTGDPEHRMRSNRLFRDSRYKTEQEAERCCSREATTLKQHATAAENRDHHPETGVSHVKGAYSRAGVDRNVSSDALQPEDYVVIISHPDGGEKCFSVGHAIVFPCAGLTAHARAAPASKHCIDPPVHQNGLRAPSKLEEERTWFTLPKRLGMNFDRYYSTQSIYGCSGAPVLLLKRSLRHLRMPVLDTSQHSGTCCLDNGLNFGFATPFMPSMFGSSRCPERVSEAALPHFRAAVQTGDWSPDTSRDSDCFSLGRVRSSSTALEVPRRRDITGRSAASRDWPPTCDISSRGRQEKDEAANCSSECSTRDVDRMPETKFGMRPGILDTASSAPKRDQAKCPSHVRRIRESVALTTPNCFGENYIQARREAGWKANANHFPLLRSKPESSYAPAIPVGQKVVLHLADHDGPLNTQYSRKVLMPEVGSSKELDAPRAASDASSSRCSSAGANLFHANGMRPAANVCSSRPPLVLNRDSRNGAVFCPYSGGAHAGASGRPRGSEGRGSLLNKYILEGSSGVQYHGLENLNMHPSDDVFQYHRAVSIDDGQNQCVRNPTVDPATWHCRHSSGVAVASYKDGERTDPGFHGRLFGQNLVPGDMQVAEPYPGFFCDIQNQVGGVWNRKTTNPRGSERDVSHWPPPCRNAREFKIFDS